MRESYDIRDSHSTYKTVNYYYKSMPCNANEHPYNPLTGWERFIHDSFNNISTNRGCRHDEGGCYGI